MKDRVTVIVPVYNTATYLERCVDSLVNQVYQNLEIILVNDGSTDGSADICRRYVRQDRRIKLIEKENGGLADARNAGLDIAVGAYICFVDSDDFLPTEAIKKMRDALLVSQSEICLGRMTVVDSSKSCNVQKEEMSGTYVAQSAVPMSGQEMLKLFGQHPPIGHTSACAKLYRATIFATLRFPFGKLHEDEFLYHLIFFNCPSVCVISDTVYFYYTRGDSITHQGKMEKHLDILDAMLERIFFYRDMKAKELLPGAFRSYMYQYSYLSGHLERCALIGIRWRQHRKNYRILYKDVWQCPQKTVVVKYYAVLVMPRVMFALHALLRET